MPCPHVDQKPLTFWRNGALVRVWFKCLACRRVRYHNGRHWFRPSPRSRVN